MSNDARRFLVAYDISNDKRRIKLANLLQSYGYRLQYSLFQVDAKPAHMQRLMNKMKDAIKLSEDSVLVIDLGTVSSAKHGKMKRIGDSQDARPEGPMIF